MPLFAPGHQSTTGMIWITNGKIKKMVYPDVPFPEGFVKGKALKEERFCATCGDLFFEDKCEVRKYCSEACRHAKRTAKEERFCVICGASFFEHKSAIRRYCSKACKYAERIYITDGVHETMIREGDDIPPGMRRGRAPRERKNTEERICIGCGKTFFEFKSNTGKYCNKECRKADETKPKRIWITNGTDGRKILVTEDIPTSWNYLVSQFLGNRFLPVS